MRITVAGAGNVGCAQAAHLALQGHEVTMFELPGFSFRLESIRQNGGLDYSGTIGSGKVEIAHLTSDPDAAAKEAEVVFITSPAYAHLAFLNALLQHLQEDCIVVFIAYFGALRAREWAKRARLPLRCILAEIESSFYATRLVNPSHIDIRGIKQEVGIAALPARQTGRVIETVGKCYSNLLEMQNVLETSLNNINPTMHTAIMTSNLGRIKAIEGEPSTEETHDWGFYENGLSPAVQRIVAAMDSEKLEIADKLNLKVEATKEHERRLYSYVDPNTGELKEMPRRDRKEAPRSLTHRYYTEDIPFGLVPMCSLGNLVGVDTPTMASVVHLASAALGTNFFREGVSVRELGLDGLSAEEILDAVS